MSVSHTHARSRTFFSFSPPSHSSNEASHDYYSERPWGRVLAQVNLFSFLFFSVFPFVTQIQARSSCCCCSPVVDTQSRSDTILDRYYYHVQEYL